MISFFKINNRRPFGGLCYPGLDKMFGVPRNIHRIPRVGECFIWVAAMGRVYEHNLSDVALVCLRSRTHTQAHIEASLSSNRRILQC